MNINVIKQRKYLGKLETIQTYKAILFTYLIHL